MISFSMFYSVERRRIFFGTSCTVFIHTFREDCTCYMNTQRSIYASILADLSFLKRFSLMNRTKVMKINQILREVL